MNKKLKIILISVTVFILTVGAGFLILHRSPSSVTVLPKSDFRNYTHPGYGFSFEYPAGWNASSFSEGEGEVVLMQNTDKQASLQIYIMMFEETGPITKERILEDLPDLKIVSEKQINIAGTINALSFESENESSQKTQEVWFVYNNFLYQISAAGNGEVLDKIIQTWKFN